MWLYNIEIIYKLEIKMVIMDLFESTIMQGLSSNIMRKTSSCRYYKENIRKSADRHGSLAHGSLAQQLQLGPCELSDKGYYKKGVSSCI